MPAARKEEADEDLVARVLGGETTAFRVLVERYQTLVLRLVRNFAPRSSAHEDLAQDAFVAAFIGLDRFDGGRGSFAAWLYTIARNKCINASKKMSPTIMADPPSAVLHTTPDDELAHSEVCRTLDDALDAMSDELRTSFVMTEIVGVSTDQVAELEGVTPGAIRARLSRARAILREAVSERTRRAT
jgi:RNA polymerase sigma-70 factor (ECF subfamily)